MEAEGRSLSFLENVGKIKVPFFQRSYVWDNENWQDLLDELYENKTSAFLGSLIFKPNTVRTGDKMSVMVIDGQQRLTTLSILLKALYDSFPNEIKKNAEHALHSALFYRESSTSGDLKIKIEHSRIDCKYYEMVINTNDSTKLFKTLKPEEHKILGCYAFFAKSISTRNFEENRKLFDRLLSDSYRIIVNVTLSAEDDEQTIFDVINNAGVRLSIADTIKNNMFQKLLDLIKDEEKVIKTYEKYWDSIFNKDEESIKYWEATKVTGRLKRTNLEILLHCVAIIENIYDPDEHTLEQLGKIYQEKIKNMNSDELLTFIKIFSEFADLYRKYIKEIDPEKKGKKETFSYNNYETRIFHILDKCDITTFHPYILHIYMTYKDRENEIKEKLLKLEKYVIRRSIANKETKSYNKICKEFINDETAINKRLLETTDDEIKESLKYISNKTAKLVLFWIELFREHNNKKYSEKLLEYSYSLEHIMPQKWQEYWHNVPIKDEFGEVITDSLKAIEVRERYIYSIGNMTLLSQALNTSLRNREFRIKIEGDNKIDGIKKFSRLSITIDDLIAEYEKSDEGKIWDEKRIRERTEKLAKEVLEIWKV